MQHLSLVQKNKCKETRIEAKRNNRLKKVQINKKQMTIKFGT
jgi:hypothetical protein